MTDINDKAVETLLEWFRKLVDGRIAHANFTKVFPSTVYSVNQDSTYTIIKDKQKYNVKNGLGTAISLGQNVWVMIPNGELRNMFVCGIR